MKRLLFCAVFLMVSVAIVHADSTRGGSYETVMVDGHRFGLRLSADSNNELQILTVMDEPREQNRSIKNETPEYVLSYFVPLTFHYDPAKYNCDEAQEELLKYFKSGLQDIYLRDSFIVCHHEGEIMGYAAFESENFNGYNALLDYVGKHDGVEVLGHRIVFNKIQSMIVRTNLECLFCENYYCNEIYSDWRSRYQNKLMQRWFEKRPFIASLEKWFHEPDKELFLGSLVNDYENRPGWLEFYKDKLQRSNLVQLWIDYVILTSDGRIVDNSSTHIFDVVFRKCTSEPNGFCY